MSRCFSHTKKPELIQELAALLGGRVDFADEISVRTIRRQLSQRKFSESQNTREHVVEIVNQPADHGRRLLEPSLQLHLLRPFRPAL